VELQHRVTLITGGKRIGSVVARELAACGADVAFSYARSKAEAEHAAEMVRATGCRAATFQADLSQPETASKLVTAVAETLGHVDILINMASVYVQRPFANLNLADWSGAMDVDLRAAFLCAHAAAPYMQA